jgi:hypothetical protein
VNLNPSHKVEGGRDEYFLCVEKKSGQKNFLGTLYHSNQTILIRTKPVRMYN